MGLKTKRNGTKKARLVVVGCAQRPGIDFDQTHCSTLKSTSLRFLAATAAIQGLHMRRYDFVSAILQDDLEPGEQIVCRLLPGHETLGQDGNNKVWRVLIPIYGMQQGGRRWQRSLFLWTRSLGLTQCDTDNYVFSMTTADDALVWVAMSTTSSSSTSKMAPTHCYASFTRELTRRWELEDEGEVANLLNIGIARQGTSIKLNQSAYITKLTNEWFPNGTPSSVQRNPEPHTEDIRELGIHATRGRSPARRSRARKRF